MTIRSMPPASSHLAESPVPAPPPTIGWPRRIISRKRSTRARRSKRGMSAPVGRHDVEECVGESRGEGRIVDCLRALDQAALRRGYEGLADRGKERGVGLGVV